MNRIRRHRATNGKVTTIRAVQKPASEEAKFFADPQLSAYMFSRNLLSLVG